MEIKNNLVSQVEEAEQQDIEPLVAEIQSKFQTVLDIAWFEDICLSIIYLYS